MAFIQPPRLADVRRSVAVRLKVGPQAEQSPTMRETLDELIRRASRELLLEAHWVELRFRSRLDLIDGQGFYDWPDNLDPGRLEEVCVVSTSNDIVPLQRGLHPEERADFLRGHATAFVEEQLPDQTGGYSQTTTGPEWKSMPLRYEIVNQQLLVLPLPDTERYPYLTLEGYSRPPSPRMNDDLIPVDEEALIQKATMLGKFEFNRPDAGAAKVMLDEYLRRLRPMQGEGETIRLGGHFSRKFRYNRRRGSHAEHLNHPNYWLLP